MDDTVKQETPPTPFKNRKEVERQAQDVLRRHGLHSIPVDPVLLANREGIKVHNAKFSEESLSGVISQRGDDKMILVNRDDSVTRKRFTIAHELGHHFLHLLGDQGEFIDYKIDLLRAPDNENVGEQKRKEIQANQFAAALLMPADLVREAFEIEPDPEKLADDFRVSNDAMRIRLVTLGLV